MYLVIKLIYIIKHFQGWGGWSYPGLSLVCMLNIEVNLYRLGQLLEFSLNCVT